ncbi:MAG TPA: copper resistance CopC family protein [Longimicrobium sp.]|nr:copper resistance CopC family protein [Longimicrobium sp.]
MMVIDTLRKRVAARVLALAGAAVLVTAAAARPGSADAFHLRLLRSDPMADSTVTTPPSAIRLWFSHAPEVAVTRVEVTGPGDRPVATAPLQRGGRDHEAPLVAQLRSRPAPGRYSVAWRTMADDGHVVRGTFHFTVAAPATQGR